MLSVGLWMKGKVFHRWRGKRTVSHFRFSMGDFRFVRGTPTLAYPAGRRGRGDAPSRFGSPKVVRFKVGLSPAA
jgi:hypothetical protein